MTVREDLREAMNVGAGRYAAALEQLAAMGLPAEFTQTGGMCAALEVRLERGYLLITDTEDSLPWNQAEQDGWGVGYYPSDDYSEGPVVFVEDFDTSASALTSLVVQCLQEAAPKSRRLWLTRRTSA